MSAAYAARPLPRPRALGIQAAIAIVVLAAWQLVPGIPGLTKVSIFFDRQFVSSPSAIAAAVVDLATGAQNTTPIWGSLAETVRNAVIGTLIGMLVGIVLGLLLSNDERLSQVLRPIIVASNSIPRIALLPLIVILVGPNSRTSLFAGVLTGFFTVFFNAYEGGRTVPSHVVDNADVLGASGTQLMRHIRFPFVLAWSFATLPNAVSHGLLAVVTAEVLSGTPGIGRFLTNALVTSNAAQVFAIVVYISVVGLILVAGSDLLQRRWLHWWGEGRL